MDYLDNKDIEGLQQYFKNLENTEYSKMFRFSDNTQKGEFEEFNNKKLSTKISIDFFLNEVKVYIVIPHKEIKIEKIEDAQGKEKEIKKTIIKKQNKLIIRTDFKISEDFKSVQANGKIYIIPDYFNKESVKNMDDDTWQIIFYQLFQEEIEKNL